ncbi:MAG: MFS transporter, partial [Halieaceae bacterium]|nr:MFS transporter [Halieaceae bacterium]
LLHGLAFAIFFAVLGLPLGRLADRYNRRNIIAAGITVWSLMTAVCGLAGNFVQLFLARTGVGVGEAALSPSAYSMMSDAFPPNKLTRAIAVYSTGGTLGTGLALIIGGAIIQLVADTNNLTLPLVGELRPWQSAFFIVALPGLAVACLMFAVSEPRRRGLLRQGEVVPDSLPIADVLVFLIQRWKTYGALFAVTSFMTALSSGFIMWYPTFLIRLHDYSISQAGYSFGLLFLVFGTAGVICGGWLATSLNKRGYYDANMRVMIIGAAASGLPYVVGPLMPTAILAMSCMAVAIFSTQMIAAVCVAATQLITPNQLRGQAAAIFLLLINLIGFGLGSTGIAFFTDFVFARDDALHYSMALSAVLVIPPSIYFYWRALPAYRDCLQESKEFTETGHAS